MRQVDGVTVAHCVEGDDVFIPLSNRVLYQILEVKSVTPEPSDEVNSLLRRSLCVWR